MQSENHARVIESDVIAAGWLNAIAVTPVSECVGRWIWCEGEETDFRDFHLFIRGEVTLDEQPRAARLHVSAEDRYLLYVNGTRLGRGPARSLPTLKSYDTYDVGSCLKPGRNVIALLVYHYGFGDLVKAGHNYASGARAGVWAQLETEADSGELRRSGTDDTWRLRPAAGWVRVAGQVSATEGTSFTEVLDGGADPPDWMDPDFDDGDWPRANVVPPEDAPWERMEARYTPLMAEKAASPVRVVKTAEVLDNVLQWWGVHTDPTVAELLRTEIHLPPAHVSIENEQALITEGGDGAVVRSGFREIDGVFHPVILFDFGRQIFGFPRITLTAPAGVVVDMTHGQRMLGDRICVEHKERCHFGDRYITREGRQTWEQAEYKQFRYLQVVVRSPFERESPYAEPVTIHAVDCNLYYYPAAQRGSFASSETLLDTAWQAAVDTVYLETEDVVVCDAWRERGGHVATESTAWPLNALYAGYGDLTAIDRKLLLSAQVAREDGSLSMFFPPKKKTFDMECVNLMVLWGSAIKDHLLYTGRRQVTETLYPYLRGLMGYFRGFIGEDHLLCPPKGWYLWTDWVPLDNRYPAFTGNAYLIQGLEDAAWVAAELGHEEDAQAWREQARLVRLAVSGTFWNETEGLYADSFHGGAQTGVFSEISNGLALTVGIATPEQAARIAKRFAEPDSGMIKPTPMYVGSVAQGLFRAGFAEEAIRFLTRLRPMLEAETPPTFWETWGPYWTGANLTDHPNLPPRFSPVFTRSRAHGSGALVAAVLHQEVLGVRPTAPGFRKCVIEPRPGHLTWAKGVVPTPHGDIRVEWKIEQGRMDLRVDLPDGVEWEHPER